ncbi:MAG: hypothetical protein ABR538_09495, partial [Candidatus Binatia bacterium]
VTCNKGGDQLGHSIATNGDFNGDGVNDIAIGAPCFHVRTWPRAGRVLVINGKTGRPIFQKRGKQTGQWFGTSVSFLPDLNGDGRDEIAVGSPGYDVTGADQGDPKLNVKESAGRVDVYQRRKRRLRIFGTHANSGFGEKIAPTSKIDDDNRADFLVSASTDINEGGGAKPGRVWMVSGRNGDLLDYRVGPKAGKNYGRALCATDDLDGDGKRDFLAGSDEVNLPNVFNAGAIDLVSTADFRGVALVQVTGARGDRLGKTVDYAGFVDDDENADFIVGAHGADDNGIIRPGLVTLFDVLGRRHWVREDSIVQEKANFGFGVATIGDINGDGIKDFAASAPNFDIFTDKTQPDVGRVVTLSGEDGEPIWALNGDHRNNEFGFGLAGGVDYDLDEVPDVVVGTPGDSPFGRRGAGSVRILSGVDGRQLLRIAGRRGLETRIVTVTATSGNTAQLQSFNRNGHRQVLNTEVLKGVKVGELDVTVLNDRNIPKPRTVQAAVSGGHGSNNSTVEVWRMGRRNVMVDKFEAFPGANFSVECAGGEANGEQYEELICVQANSADGNVMARIFRRLDEQQPFFPILEFQAFASTDLLGNVLPINADGGNVAMGDVTGGSEEEIVIGTNRGVPLVKIFSRTGQLINSFLAYDPVPSSGVDVATMDPSGAGEERIITVPREGEAIIKLFTGSGARVLHGRDNVPVFINVRPLPYMGGARVAAADIDLDDAQEILVRLPTPVSEDGVIPGGPQIFAYELTNKPNKRFVPFNPLPFGMEEGGGIAGTDRYVRD